LRDALPTDPAGAFIEHPIGPCGATRQQSQLDDSVWPLDFDSAPAGCLVAHGLIMLLG